MAVFRVVNGQPSAEDETKADEIKSNDDVDSSSPDDHGTHKASCICFSRRVDDHETHESCCICFSRCLDGGFGGCYSTATVGSSEENDHCFMPAECVTLSKEIQQQKKTFDTELAEKIKEINQAIDGFNEEYAGEYGNNILPHVKEAKDLTDVIRLANGPMKQALSFGQCDNLRAWVETAKSSADLKAFNDNMKQVRKQGRFFCIAPGSGLLSIAYGIMDPATLLVAFGGTVLGFDFCWSCVQKRHYEYVRLHMRLELGTPSKSQSRDSKNFFRTSVCAPEPCSHRAPRVKLRGS